MAEELEQAGKKGKKAGEDIADAFVNGAKEIYSSFGGITSVMGGTLKMIDLFKAKWDEVIQRQKEALGLTVGLEGANRKMLDALNPKAARMKKPTRVWDGSRGSTWGG